MPPVDALKQGDRGESVVYPGQLPRELRARPAPTTDQPRLWLVVRLIIGVRHETGNTEGGKPLVSFAYASRALAEAAATSGIGSAERNFGSSLRRISERSDPPSFN